MRTQTVAFALAVVIGIAGCSAAPQADESEPSAPGPSIAPGPDNERDASMLNRTASRPPAWQVGEWWRIKITPAVNVPPFEVTRVVAGVEGDNYLVGMPRDEFSHEAMVLHVPGFGLVDQLDLGFEIHDVLFIPVQFPLEEGRKWDTAFEGRSMSARVTAVDASSATVRMERQDDQGNVVEWVEGDYDIGLGEFRLMEISDYATLEVVDHGFAYEGVVTVPHQHDVIFLHGRVAGALNVGGGTPADAPMEEIVVDPTYQRVSFVIILGDIDPSLPGLGHYMASVVAPDETEYQLMMNPGDGPGYTIGVYSHDSPGGTWQAEFVAAGPGIAMVEGIAYHVFDVRLPEGCLMPADGEHEHGDSSCGSGQPDPEE